LGIGDWGLGPIPNPQSPIPNPQSPIPNPHVINYLTFNGTYNDQKILQFKIFKISKKINK
jgi:hypothetical protein